MNIFDWHQITTDNQTMLPDGQKMVVQRLTEEVERDWLQEVTGEDMVCRHDRIQYRVKTTDKHYAYMCADCFRKILSGTNHNRMGFTQSVALKLREYLERKVL